MNPPAKKRLMVSPKEWLVHALSDLKMAKLGQEDQDILPEQICFHAQQAVEKAFKAILLFSKVDFPLTHDLQELIEVCEEAGIVLPEDLKDVDTLTPYAVETRYPGYWEAITDEYSPTPTVGL
jgi:HEPN domain-containing protein